MQKLTVKEEEIMNIIWELDEAFIREVHENFKKPKPHYNTVATLIKILVKKGFLNSEKIGNMHRYRPLISYDQYRNEDLDEIKKKYFNNSLSKLFTHFAKIENLSKAEKEELIKIIKSKKS